MVKKILIIPFIGLLIVSCSTTDARVSVAAKQVGEANAEASLPVALPGDCTAKMGRVKPGSEAWVLVQKRWEILAENRDDRAINCGKWWDDYRSAVAKSRGSL